MEVERVPGGPRGRLLVAVSEAVKEGGDSLGAEMTERNVWGRRKPGMVRGQVSRGLWEHEPLWGKAGLERQAGVRRGGSSFQTQQLEACPRDAAGLQRARLGARARSVGGQPPGGCGR